MQPKHTPTPWEVYGPSVQGLVIKHGQLNVAFIPQELSSVDEANAAFIVRAVNAHEANEYLAEAINNVCGQVSDGTLTEKQGLLIIAQALLNRDAAIAKAEGR